ncbi:MAG TPA: hypothetical protein VMH87_07625 [Pseudomonadales bacterium]|nr:hypothetical protein [Pseudomonadales bacterium]
MKKILLKTAAVMSLLLALHATAQIQYSNEFWISTNATGNIYPSGGTLDNPLDGSTESNFTANVYALPPNSVIHLLPGLFKEYNYWGDPGPGWVKTGDKIIGSGIDVTIIQLDSTAHDGLGVLNNNSGSCQNVEISDLTADANSAPPSIGHPGVTIEGTENAIRRVKVINNYGIGETDGLALNNYTQPDSEGNIIEECVVSNYLGGSVDAINLGGGSPTNMISGIIRNNRVDFPPEEVASVFLINLCFAQNTLIEGNYFSGGNVQIHCDTGGFYNTIIAHNFFLNCLDGIAPQTVDANEDHITIAFNNISLLWTNNFSSVAFHFWGSPQSDIKIIGNTIQTSGSGSGDGAYIMNASDLTGLDFKDNSVESLLVSNQVALWTPYRYTNVVNANIDNNYDLYGNYLYELNVPTLGGVSVSSFGLSLISSAEASSALTNLGLPSNPANVVTNNETGVTLSGTFSGNGGGLTNLNASQLSSGRIPLAQLAYCIGTVRHAGAGSYILTNSVGCTITNGGYPPMIGVLFTTPANNPYYVVAGLGPIPYLTYTNGFTFAVSGTTPTNYCFVVFSP